VVKVNGNDNHMVKRAEVMGVIEANENWTPAYLSYAGRRCNLGQILAVMGGFTDNELATMYNPVAYKEGARVTGLEESTIRRIVSLNDRVRTREQNVRVIRTYLLGKSFTRAWNRATRFHYPH
jgi:hypothetical protein